MHDVQASSRKKKRPTSNRYGPHTKNVRRLTRPANRYGPRHPTFHGTESGDFDHPRHAALAFSLAIWRQEWSRVLIFVNPYWVGKLQNDHVRRRRQAFGSIEVHVRSLNAKPFRRVRVKVSGVTILSHRLMNALLASKT